jgi:hypothetical protein
LDEFRFVETPAVQFLDEPIQELFNNDGSHIDGSHIEQTIDAAAPKH